ncbi:GNAT family N-acetyltransferase (plasmid) [Deinococcus radiomollis]|uniref:GNAT family N-acetyltransferase n=1 Tax=Deinococcus radiomollis TaxID=468916 RepID=UPI0038918B3D
MSAGAPPADPLENPFWHALAGPQVAFARLGPRAGRYLPGVSPMGALEADTPESWTDLEALTAPGEVVAVFWPDVLDPPVSWSHQGGGNAVQMVQRRAQPPLSAPAGLVLRELGPQDVPQMLDLVRLTRPGPFRERTVELGLYLGLWDDSAPEGSRLAAMTGQRARTRNACEVSAVCTHPAYRRRGLARTLVSQVAARTAEAGLQPFLHVSQDNLAALETYRSLGFLPSRRLSINVLRRDAGES